MKLKQKIAALLIAAVVLFTACGQENQTNSYTVLYENETYTVDMDAHTITGAGQTYGYSFSGSHDDLRYEIQYPNGATYFWNDTAVGGHGGWSNDYDPETMIPGDVLISMLSSQTTQEEKPLVSPLLGLICVALGVVTTIFPDKVWYINTGWKFKDVEPSDALLTVSRLGGIALAVFGSFALLAAL